MLNIQQCETITILRFLQRFKNLSILYRVSLAMYVFSLTLLAEVVRLWCCPPLFPLFFFFPSLAFELRIKILQEWLSFNVRGNSKATKWGQLRDDWGANMPMMRKWNIPPGISRLQKRSKEPEVDQVCHLQSFSLFYLFIL